MSYTRISIDEYREYCRKGIKIPLEPDIKYLVVQGSGHFTEEYTSFPKVPTTFENHQTFVNLDITTVPSNWSFRDIASFQNCKNLTTVEPCKYEQTAQYMFIRCPKIHKIKRKLKDVRFEERCGELEFDINHEIKKITLIRSPIQTLNINCNALVIVDCPNLTNFGPDFKCKATIIAENLIGNIYNNPIKKAEINVRTALLQNISKLGDMALLDTINRLPNEYIIKNSTREDIVNIHTRLKDTETKVRELKKISDQMEHKHKKITDALKIINPPHD
jgi:hypothetical protein